MLKIKANIVAIWQYITVAWHRCVGLNDGIRRAQQNSSLFAVCPAESIADGEICSFRVERAAKARNPLYSFQRRVSEPVRPPWRWAKFGIEPGTRRSDPMRFRMDLRLLKQNFRIPAHNHLRLIIGSENTKIVESAISRFSREVTNRSLAGNATERLAERCAVTHIL